MTHFHMVWTKQELPSAPIPTGYRIRTYRAGDESGWMDCCAGGGLGTQEWQAGDFRKNMLEMTGLCAEGIYFIVDSQGQIAGTTAAVRETDCGYIHMVGVNQIYQGKGLGKPVNLAAMQDLVDAGYETIRLETDDWRIPAIKIYLWLGFSPVVDSVSTYNALQEVMRALHITRLQARKLNGDCDAEIVLSRRCAHE